MDPGAAEVTSGAFSYRRNNSGLCPKPPVASTVSRASTTSPDSVRTPATRPPSTTRPAARVDSRTSIRPDSTWGATARSSASAIGTAIRDVCTVRAVRYGSWPKTSRGVRGSHSTPRSSNQSTVPGCSSTESRVRSSRAVPIEIRWMSSQCASRESAIPLAAWARVPAPETCPPL